MNFQLPPLPYAKDALEPYMSRETMELHYEKHHRGYLGKLQKALDERSAASKSLVQIIRSSEGDVYENAAQVWNHTFFWASMEPRGGGEPGGDVARWIKDAFGSYDSFREKFLSVGTSLFGSGYLWLAIDGHHEMRLFTTANADNPLTRGYTPLLCCDLWEHAYYLDHRNERAKYLEGFLDHLVHWDQTAEYMKRAA